MRRIRVFSPTHGIKFILVDDADYEMVKSRKWCVSQESSSHYAYTHIVNSNGKKTTLKVHRLIMGVTDPKIIVDHKNRNGMDNRRCNLRLCNKSQNGVNRDKKPGKSSKYLGVTWYAQRKKWIAFAVKDRKDYHIGYFSSEIEAAKARDKKVVELHGEFAKLNFQL